MIQCKVHFHLVTRRLMAILHNSLGNDVILWEDDWKLRFIWQII